MKDRHRARRALPDPADVLSRRVRVNARDLFALIRDVNPTSGEDSPRERERYLLKSRLQSFLITSFADEVRAVPDATNLDLVLLEHRSGLEHACHALLSQLSDEARALIRRQLDQSCAPGLLAPSLKARNGPDGTERKRDGGVLAPSTDALALGRKALAAYDYEEAERLLSLAVDQGAGKEAVRELLELLLDVFSSHSEALLVADRLPQATLDDPAIRELVAEATSRAGSIEKALRLVRDLRGPRAASVHASAARAAIDNGDTARAIEHIEKARDCDPGSPIVRQLAEEMERSQKRQQELAEKALLDAISKDSVDRDGEALQARARDLLTRWPSSAIASRVLHEQEARQRSSRAAKSFDEGLASLERGDAQGAVRLLRLAMHMAPSLQQIPELLAKAEAEAARQLEDSEVRRTVQALASPNPTTGLIEYAELSAELRARIRRESSLQELALIEDLLATSPTIKPRAAVDATFALMDARSQTLSGNPESALKILESHKKALGAVSEAADTEKAARQLAAEQRSKRFQEALDAARQFMCQGDLSAAEGRLAELRKMESVPSLKEEVSAFTAELAGRLEQASLERSHASARRSGDFLLARRIASKLVERNLGEAKALWDEREQLDRAEIRQASRILVSTEPGLLDELCDLPPTAIRPRSCPTAMAGGKQVVIGESFDRWIFVRIIDTATGAIIRRISLCVRKQLGTSVGQAVDGKHFLVFWEEGEYLDLDLETADIIEFRSLSSLLQPGSIFVEAPFLSSTVCAIALSSHDDLDSKIAAIDLQRFRVLRTRTCGMTPAGIYLGPSSRLLLAENDRLRILTADGSHVVGEQALAKLEIQGAAPAPAGDSIIVAGQFLDPSIDDLGKVPGPDWDLEALQIARIDLGPVPDAVPFLSLEDSDGMRVFGLSTARSGGAAFLVNFVEWEDSERDGYLRRISCDADGLHPEKAVRVPEETALFYDRESEHVAVICLKNSGVWTAPLTSESVLHPIPRSEDRPSPRDLPLTGRQSPIFCRPIDRSLNARSLAICAQLGNRAPTLSWANRILAENHDAPHLIALSHAVERLQGDPALSRSFEDAAIKRFPGDPHVVSLRTLRAGEQGDWETVRLLVDEPLEGLDPAVMKHIFHTQAMALLHSLAYLEAVAVLDKAMNIESGDCRLEPLMEFAQAILFPDDPAETVSAKLLKALFEADRALAEGDYRRATGILDSGLIWGTNTIQAHARLARAWARIEPRNSPERFRRRRALSCFLHLLASPFSSSPLPPFPGALSQQEIEEILQQVREALEQEDA